MLVQRLGIAAGREFIARQALELKPIEKLKYKITTKSPTEFRPPELLLIVNCSRLFQRQALQQYFCCTFALRHGVSNSLTCPTK